LEELKKKKKKQIKKVVQLNAKVRTKHPKKTSEGICTQHAREKKNYIYIYIYTHFFKYKKSIIVI